MFKPISGVDTRAFSGARESSDRVSPWINAVMATRYGRRLDPWSAAVGASGGRCPELVDMVSMENQVPELILFELG